MDNRNQKPKNLDVRHLTNIMRNLKKQAHNSSSIIKEEQEVQSSTTNQAQTNELTPEEIKQEEENFEKAVPDGIAQITSVTKNGKDLNLTGGIRIDDYVIGFNFKLDSGSMNTENIPLNDINIKIINDIYNYYKSWKGVWMQKINVSDNQTQSV